MSGMTVRRMEISTSITAVKCIRQDLIMTGKGGEVNLLEWEGEAWRRLAKQQVFPSQCVHGLAASTLPSCSAGTQVLVFGGRLYSLTLISPSSSIKVLWSGSSEDWILDGCWLAQDRIALLTAHGKLVEVTSSTGQLTRTAICSDRSILYSARVISRADWNQVILLGGTVHNQILVWSPGHPGTPSTELAALSGHKGVIFSVRYDEVSHRICSTSDDRTARLWTLSVGSGNGLRTGCSVDEWIAKGSVDFRLELTLYGHKARVWDSAFLPHSLLATVAEDGGVMMWSEKGDCLMQSWTEGGLLCLDLLPSGPGERSPSLDASSLSDLVLSAGSSDGSLYLFPMSLHSPSPTAIPLCGGAPKTVCLGDIEQGGGVICLTETGQLELVTPAEGDACHPAGHQVGGDCILSLSPGRDRLAVGLATGHLQLFTIVDTTKLEETLRSRVTEGKMFSLHWLSEEQLLACGPEGSLRLLSLPTPTSIDKSIRVVKRLVLPACKQRWTTCATLASPHYLVCGDRQGSLHLYSTKDTPEEGGPQHSLRGVHGPRGVSWVGVRSGGGIKSCGRDGTLREFSLQAQGSDCRLSPLVSLRLPMDWTSHVVESKLFGPLIVGFHNVYLCLWSLREGRHLMKLRCWGGHRSWDLHLDTSSTLRVAFVKDKCVHFLATPLKRLALPALQRGLHSGAINGCAWVPEWELLVSGGEDTSVRTSSAETLAPLCVARSHVSAVRCVALARTTGLMGSAVIATAGARAQLKLWTLSKSGELCERSSTMLRGEEDLRRGRQSGEALDEPEVRYMDLTIAILGTTTLLYLAASDGCIRVFEMDPVTMSIRLTLVCECRQGRCLLKMESLPVPSQSRVLCFAASTDGFVTFYSHSSPSAELKSLQALKIHGGGVNALKAHLLSEPRSGDAAQVLLVTGGDDSCLVASLFSFDHLSSFPTCLSTFRLDSLHVCQITGVDIVGEYIASAGLDSRLCLVRWSQDSHHQLTASCVHTYLSCLPDIHGLQTYLKQNDLSVCLYGIGIEIISVALPST